MNEDNNNNFILVDEDKPKEKTGKTKNKTERLDTSSLLKNWV